MSSSPNQSLESMLSQRRFLRPIVRALLRGADGEDDVVQEALVRAWQSPVEPAQTRSWLARIARNLSLDRLRAARRAARLRQRLPAEDAAPSPDEVLQQEEQRRRIVHAVLALPQPYRSIVLLRYWEDLTPSVIALRLCVPGATVRSQLLRGLAMVRERLDGEFGDRRAWTCALAPCAGFVRGTDLAWRIALMTKTKIAMAGVALLACGLVLWWLLASTGPQPDHAQQLPEVNSGGTLTADLRPSSPAVAAAEEPAGAVERIAVETAELTVRGQVKHKGVPYPKLTLTLQWFAGFSTGGDPERTYVVTCDDQGQFEWSGPARTVPGMVSAVVPPSPLKFWCTPELVTPGQRQVTLQVDVIPLDRVLSGRVHARDGSPIAGARLDINLWPETEVATDAVGRYEMHVPAPGYPLSVRAPGFRTRLVQSYLPADTFRHEFDVELTPGERLEGRVVDAEGRPVAGARVRGMMHGVDSDALGHFVLGGFFESGRQEVTAKKSGFELGRASGVPGGEPVRIVLRPGLSVELRVIGTDAAPIAGAVVHLVPNPMAGLQRLGITQVDGRFTVADLPSQPVELVVQRAGHITVRRSVDPLEAKGELVITLGKGHAIRGQVVDSAGRPVAGASIYCERKGVPMIERSIGTRDNTGPDGRFEVKDLPAEPCTLFAHHRDYQRGEFAFTGGATAVTTLRLVRSLALAGRVVDGATGEPVTAFTVALEPGRERSVFLDPLPFQAADGRFRLADWRLPAGVPLVLVITAVGYAPARLTQEAVPEPSADLNLVRLVAGTRVEGVVRDANTGAPLQGVTVALANDDARRRPNEGPATDATGRFKLEAVPSGEHRLVLQHPERPEVVFGPFVVGAGPGLLEVQPTMSRGVTLRGRFTGLADAVGLSAMAYRTDGRLAQARIGSDLAFEFTGLGKGLTCLQVTQRTGRTRTVRIEVGEADVEGLEVPLHSGSGVLRLDVDGLTRGTVEVRRLDAAAGELATIDSVPYRGATLLVDGLAPGRYRVTVRGDDLGKGTAEVDVGNGEAAVRVAYAPPK